jgi:hypothetical protein
MKYLLKVLGMKSPSLPNAVALPLRKLRQMIRPTPLEKRLKQLTAMTLMLSNQSQLVVDAEGGVVAPLTTCLLLLSRMERPHLNDADHEAKALTQARDIRLLMKAATTPK